MRDHRLLDRYGLRPGSVGDHTTAFDRLPSLSTINISHGGVQGQRVRPCTPASTPSSFGGHGVSCRNGRRCRWTPLNHGCRLSPINRLSPSEKRRIQRESSMLKHAFLICQLLVPLTHAAAQGQPNQEPVSVEVVAPPPNTSQPPRLLLVQGTPLLTAQAAHHISATSTPTQTQSLGPPTRTHRARQLGNPRQQRPRPSFGNTTTRLSGASTRSTCSLATRERSSVL
jgi:hypothetical protein